MEITIDIRLVRRIVSQETEQACADIERGGPIAACERSQRRHDARLRSAPDAHTLACKDGCSWCCHFSVDVRAVEVFRILDFVTRELSPEEQERARREIETNSVQLRDLDEIERMRRNVKCPFLAEGRCTIYDARPQTCRNYHATDVSGCRASYEHPDDVEIDPDFAPLVYQTGGAHVDAFCNALQQHGYDIQVYELNTALAAAMAQPQARSRFEAKQPPFATLAGAEIPMEFLDP